MKAPRGDEVVRGEAGGVRDSLGGVGFWELFELLNEWDPEEDRGCGTMGAKVLELESVGEDREERVRGGDVRVKVVGAAWVGEGGRLE